MSPPTLATLDGPPIQCLLSFLPLLDQCRLALTSRSLSAIVKDSNKFVPLTFTLMKQVRKFLLEDEYDEEKIAGIEAVLGAVNFEASREKCTDDPAGWVCVAHTTSSIEMYDSNYSSSTTIVRIPVPTSDHPNHVHPPLHIYLTTESAGGYTEYYSGEEKDIEYSVILPSANSSANDDKFTQYKFMSYYRHPRGETDISVHMPPLERMGIRFGNAAVTPEELLALFDKAHVFPSFCAEDSDDKGGFEQQLEAAKVSTDGLRSRLMEAIDGVPVTIRDVLYRLADYESQRRPPSDPQWRWRKRSCTGFHSIQSVLDRVVAEAKGKKKLEDVPGIFEQLWERMEESVSPPQPQRHEAKKAEHKQQNGGGEKLTCEELFMESHLPGATEWLKNCVRFTALAFNHAKGCQSDYGISGWEGFANFEITTQTPQAATVTCTYFAASLHVFDCPGTSRCFLVHAMGRRAQFTESPHRAVDRCMDPSAQLVQFPGKM